jgi:hypothetical protein
MLRENQGLQVALIVFFMLAVVLAVATFLCGGKFLQAQQQTLGEEQMAAQGQRALASKEAECAELKRMIGLPDKPLAEVQAQFKKDMQTYGANYPEAARGWSPILAYMWDTIVDRNKENVALKTNLQDLQSRFAVREEQKDGMIKQLAAAVKDAGERAAAADRAAAEERARMGTELADVLHKLDDVQKAFDRKSATAGLDLARAHEQVTRLAEQNKALVERLKGFERPTMDRPQGEVTWVDQRSRTVWINLGRADSLDRQTTFGVYSGDVAEMGKAKKKATIEVTKITGDHSAEARVTEDKTADPITPGDKIFTPLWSPGQQPHFALAGIMNIDGDGRNAVSTVRNLITANGGQVDCLVDESGNKIGEVTPATRYVVRGDDPKDAKQMQAMSKILRDAERFGARLMSLADLREQTGYRPGTVGGRSQRPAGEPQRPLPPSQRGEAAPAAR